jgi:NADP-dependent 3-hydroxy acid dehydrogenase YdfG
VKKVYATARNPEALRALRDERLVSLRLDVTDADQIRAAGEVASDVELVFNNAGVALATGIADARLRVSSSGRRAPRSSASTQAPLTPT